MRASFQNFPPFFRRFCRIVSGKELPPFWVKYYKTRKLCIVLGTCFASAPGKSVIKAFNDALQQLIEGPQSYDSYILKPWRKSLKHLQCPYQ